MVSCNENSEVENEIMIEGAGALGIGMSLEGASNSGSQLSFAHEPL